MASPGKATWHHRSLQWKDLTHPELWEARSAQICKLFSSFPFLSLTDEITFQLGLYYQFLPAYLVPAWGVMSKSFVVVRAFVAELHTDDGIFPIWISCNKEQWVLSCIHMTQVDYRQAWELHQLRSEYGTTQSHQWHYHGSQQALLTISITLTHYLAQPMPWASMHSQTTPGDVSMTAPQ